MRRAGSTRGVRRRDWLAIEDDGGHYADALERGTGVDGEAWVKIPRDFLTRRRERTVSATWDGACVHVVGVEDDHAAVRHFDDADWAARRGRVHGVGLGPVEGDDERGADRLTGSGYEGYWYGRAPIDQLQDITVTDIEKPSR